MAIITVADRRHDEQETMPEPQPGTSGTITRYMAKHR
jgi:hypothetical protein